MPAWLEVPGLFLAGLLYRVRAIGADNVPAAGGAVLIANHLSYVDVVVLQRPVAQIEFNSVERHPGSSLRWYLRD